MWKFKIAETFRATAYGWLTIGDPAKENSDSFARAWRKVAKAPNDLHFGAKDLISSIGATFLTFTACEGWKTWADDFRFLIVAANFIARGPGRMTIADWVPIGPLFAERFRFDAARKPEKPKEYNLFRTIEY